MVVFREIEKHEVEAAVEMMQRFYAIDNYPIDIKHTKEIFEEFIARPDYGRCWLIYKDGQLAGYLILTFVFSFEYGGRIGFVDELFIEDSFRSRGIGKSAISFATEQADKLSLKLLYLEVEPHNLAAQKLYIAAGFQAHKRILLKHTLHTK